MTVEEDLKRVHERLDRHSERIHKVEERQAANDKELEGVKTDVGNLSSKFSLYQNEINSSLRSMKRWLIIIGCLAAGAFIYMAIKNEKAAQAVISVGGLIAKIVPLVP